MTADKLWSSTLGVGHHHGKIGVLRNVRKDNVL